MEVPGIFFHVSVLVVLVRGIQRKDESFRHAFFMLYIASSVADCTFIIVVELLYGVPVMGVTPGFYRWCGDFCATAVAVGSLSLSCFQGMIHGAIALNRFTAIIVPHSHKSIWRARNTARVLLATSSLCLVASVPVVVVSAGYDYDKDTGLIVDMNVRNKQVASYRAELNAVTKVAFGLGGFALSIASVYRLHKMVKAGQLRDVRHDQNTRLLAHSVFMVAAQLLGVSYMALIEIDRFMDLGKWTRFTFMPVYGKLPTPYFAFPLLSSC